MSNSEASVSTYAPNYQVRLKYVPKPSETFLKHQWNQRVRRDKHHVSAHAAGAHDGEGQERLNCPRCRNITIPVYPVSLADYGYNKDAGEVVKV